jgi:hypothetical protein
MCSFLISRDKFLIAIHPFVNTFSNKFILVKFVYSFGIIIFGLALGDILQILVNIFINLLLTKPFENDTKFCIQYLEYKIQIITIPNSTLLNVFRDTHV